ncbi:MAG: response regulator [Candidatus Zixiibacteriota bacterium]
MSVPLRVLIVEDSEADTLLLLRQLTLGGFQPTHSRVETAGAFREALNDEAWDIVIADYLMPKFTGIMAFDILRESGKDIPFIIVSGSIGEEIAVSAMKAGVQDYVM